MTFKDNCAAYLVAQQLHSSSAVMEYNGADDGASFSLQPAMPQLCAAQADGVLLIDCAISADTDRDSMQDVLTSTAEGKYDSRERAQHFSSQSSCGSSTTADGTSQETSLAEARLRAIEERAAQAQAQPAQTLQSRDGPIDVQYKQKSIGMRVHRMELYTLDDVKLHPFPAILLHEHEKRRRYAKKQCGAHIAMTDKENLAPSIPAALPPLSSSAIKAMSCSPPTTLLLESAQESYSVGSLQLARPRQALRSSHFASDGANR